MSTAKEQGTTAGFSAVLDNGKLAELVLQRETKETCFLVGDGAQREEAGQVSLPDGRTLLPYRSGNNLLTHGVVRVPTGVSEYGDVTELVERIRAFIHRYVDLSDAFEEIATYYVLFTWIYDAYDEVPYLRVRGDYGTGKSRFLMTVGSLVYKPIFASGASSVSPLFRLLDAVEGTLVIDEGDFRVSDEKAEITKIFNNGNARGFPVLRSEATPGKEFNPRAFRVFGPKVIATRRAFEDRALESRCLTEEMGRQALRPGIPLNLPKRFATEALELRNQLLLYRFRHRMTARPAVASLNPDLEPRVRQILAPLVTLADDEPTRERLIRHAKQYGLASRKGHGVDLEREAVRVIAELRRDGTPLSMKEIALRFQTHHGTGVSSVTPRWIGALLRKRLLLTPVKRHGVFVLPASAYPQLDELTERHRVDVGDVGDVVSGSGQGDGRRNMDQTEPPDSVARA